MSDPKGHAAFHLELKNALRGSANRGDRRNLLHESMRHLSKRDAARHAAMNPSIVLADTRLNEAFINDGDGGFDHAAKISDVLNYGDARLGRVRRKITDKQITLSTFVVHLPKTLCVEVKDFYPRLNADGTEREDAHGNPLSRSRWVARDQDEAMRYFRDTVAHLTEHVIPGGHEAVHGWATNFDESTPHIQLMADPFAEDPKAPASAPDALRTEQNQAYGLHREVRDANGKVMSNRDKLSGYQREFREHMFALGWPVELEVGDRHGQELAPDEFKQAQDNLAEARARSARNAADHERLNDWDARLLEKKQEWVDRDAALVEREGLLNAREQEILAVRLLAVEDGKAEGFKAGLADGESKAQEQLAAAVLAAQAAQRRAEEERREAELEKAEAKEQRDRYAEAATEFEAMNAALRPLHEQWQQANPHTASGAKATQSLAKHDDRAERAAAARRTAEHGSDYQALG